MCMYGTYNTPFRSFSQNKSNQYVVILALWLGRKILFFIGQFVNLSYFLFFQLLSGFFFLIFFSKLLICFVFLISFIRILLCNNSSGLPGLVYIKGH